MALFKSAATVGFHTLLSRIMGLVRDVVIADRLGSGPIADAFFIAFKLPNFFRRIAAEGAFNAAFVPLFAGRLAAEGKDSAREFANQVLSVLIIGLLGLTAIMQILMPWITIVLAPGFLSDPDKFGMTVYLASVTFPYLFFISLVSFCSGVLNSLDKFASAAFAPVILNVTMIGAIIFLTQFTDTPAHALAYGVTIAGVLQLIWLLIACARAGMVFKLPRPRLTPDVRLMLKRMVPGVLGASVIQLNVFIDTTLASWIPGAVSYLYYADRVNQFPLAIIGIALSTALLPMLSRQIREGRTEDALISQNRAVEYAMFFTIPSAFALMLIALPMVTVMFQRGAFSEVDAYQTAWTLAAYGAGLPAFVLVKVLSPGFYATGDLKTPLKIMSISVCLNTIFNLILIWPFAQVGLALATSLSSWISVFMLARTLKARGIFRADARLISRGLRIFLAACMMGAVLASGMYFMEVVFFSTLTLRIAGLLLLIGAGFVTYIGTSVVIGALDLKEIRSVLFKRKALPA